MWPGFQGSRVPGRGKGHTRKAGSVFGGLAHRFGDIVVLVVLGAPSFSRWGYGVDCGPCPPGSLACEEQPGEGTASKGLERGAR